MTAYELALDAARDYVAQGYLLWLAAFTAVGHYCPTASGFDAWQASIVADLT